MIGKAMRVPRERRIMKRWIAMLSFAAAAVFVLSVVPARASESNELTYFTFSGPVALPGVALPAGTYMFKHPDLAGGDDQVVQVFSEDGRTIYGTFQTIPETIQTPKDQPTVSFAESPAGAPEEITAWFYPGRLTGDEFIYPKGQTAAKAAASN
jgi:hypothetical protein